jgi:hypothetical protein
MKVVEHTAGKLVLQDRPWLIWLVGGLFVVAGSWVALTSDERLIGAAFAVTGAVLILALANTVTATFDRGLGRFTQSSRGVVRNSETAHALSEVVSVGVHQSHSGRPSRTHRLVLGLSSGARVPLTPIFSSGKADKDRVAATIRQFLDLQELPETPIPGFGDMFRTMFDPNAGKRLGELFGGSTSQLEELVRRDPGNIEARQQLGTALAMQNRVAEAREHLQAARGLAASRGNPALAAQLDEMLARMNDAASGRS